MKKKIVYIDLDNTLADYMGEAQRLHIDPKEAKHVKGFFRNLQPLPKAVESYNKLTEHFDVYILSTAPWSNPNSLVEKMEWVKEHFPTAHKNVIFSHRKDLNIGDYLIDDLLKNGADKFTGEHIQIGTERFPDWDTVLTYIFDKENINR